MKLDTMRVGDRLTHPKYGRMTIRGGNEKEMRVSATLPGSYHDPQLDRRIPTRWPVQLTFTVDVMRRIWREGTDHFRPKENEPQATTHGSQGV